MLTREFKQWCEDGGGDYSYDSDIGMHGEHWCQFDNGHVKHRPHTSFDVISSQDRKPDWLNEQIEDAPHEVNYSAREKRYTEDGIRIQPTIEHNIWYRVTAENGSVEVLPEKLLEK